MAAVRREMVLEHLRTLVVTHDEGATSDAELLERFVRRRDETAFALLLKRHGPMVLGVGRRVLGREQDAEDVFQATFLLLARKAGSIRRRDAVSSWLYGVAHRLALRARGQHIDRKAHERRAATMRTAEPAPDLGWQELQAILDDVLAGLPEKYRVPLVLCYLEGKTQEQAARQLGCPLGTVRSWLARGRALLHRRLTRRGVALSAGALATALLANAAGAASIRITPTLLQPTLKAALAFAAGRGATGLVSAPVAGLVDGGLTLMSLAKVKTVTVVLLAVATLVAGVGIAAEQAFGDKRPAAKSDPGALAATPLAGPPRPEEGRTDRYGDPLPPGALQRLGTVRYRLPAEVEVVAFVPDGKTLAIFSKAGLFLMDAASGKRGPCLDRTPSAWAEETPFAFSPDGRHMAARGWTRDAQRYKDVVRIWDLSDGGSSKDHDILHAVWVGWSADGDPLMVCVEAEMLRLHDLASGRSRRFVCEGLSKPQQSAHVVCTCSPAGQALAVVDEVGSVHVWNTATGREQCNLQPRGEHVTCLAFSPDGRTLASLTGEAVQLWDAMTGRGLHTLATDQKYLRTVAFAPDGKTLATSGAFDVRFWDPATGRERGRTQERCALGRSIAFSRDGKTLVAAEQHGSAVHLWDVPSGRRRPEPAGHRSWAHGMSFSPDGRRLATGGGLDGSVHVWDLAIGASLTHVDRPGEWARKVAFSRDGRSLFTAWTGEEIWVCDASRGERQHIIRLEDPDRPDARQSADAMYQSADGKTLVAFSSYHPKVVGGRRYPETLVTGWDASTRLQLFRRRVPRMGGCFALSPDARVLALPYPDDRDEGIFGKGPMQLEDVATGDLLLTFPGLEGQAWPLAFSPDGRLLASWHIVYVRQGKGAGAAAYMLQLWETATAAKVLSLPSADQPRAAFSPDGRLLVLLAPAGEILVWDLARGRERCRFIGFDGQVGSFAFSPDNRRLFSGLSDSTVVVWDLGRQEDAPASKPAAEDLTKAWADLAGTDAPSAFRARWTLAAVPQEAVRLFKERLLPAQPPDAERPRKLIADLESAQFEVRQKAQAALEDLDLLAEPLLQQTLAKQPTPEVRRQLQALLERLRGPVTRPEALRSLRAVEVLEDIATPDARRQLQILADGAPGDRLTREARMSLERLSRRPPADP